MATNRPFSQAVEFEDGASLALELPPCLFEIETVSAVLLGDFARPKCLFASGPEEFQVRSALEIIVRRYTRKKAPPSLSLSKDGGLGQPCPVEGLSRNPPTRVFRLAVLLPRLQSQGPDPQRQ